MSSLLLSLSPLLEEWTPRQGQGWTLETEKERDEKMPLEPLALRAYGCHHLLPGLCACGLSFAPIFLTMWSWGVCINMEVNGQLCNNAEFFILLLNFQRPGHRHSLTLAVPTAIPMCPLYLRNSRHCGYCFLCCYFLL